MPKLKHLFQFALLVLGIAAFAPAAQAEDVSKTLHTHCVCGSGTCTVGGHTSHADITFEAWTSTTTLPQGTSPDASTSKYYYLANDVTLQAAHTNWGNVCICLNGKVIRHKNGYKGNPADYPTGHETDGRLICTTNGLFQITDCDTTTVHNYEVCEDERWLLTDKAAMRNFEDLTERPAVGDVIAIKGGALTGGNAWRYEGGAIHVRRDVNIWGGNFVGNSPCALGLPKGTQGQDHLRIYGGNIVGNRGETLDRTLKNAHPVNGGGGISFADAGGSTDTCNGGAVYLYDGRVDFNIAPSGGGVRTGGQFFMSGGTIAYNKATSSTNGFGGGILSFGLKWGGAVLTGGTITKNTAVLGGGGVYVMNDAMNSTHNPGAVNNKSGAPTGTQMYGKVTVGGTIVIQDNYLTNGMTDNVYLEKVSQNTAKKLVAPAPTLVITNAPALAAGAKIGVTTATPALPGASVAITTNNNASAAQSVYFTPDRPGEGIDFADGRFVLTGIHFVKVKPAAVDHATVSVTTNGVAIPLVAGECTVFTNMPNIKVVYTADGGGAFAGGATSWSTNFTANASQIDVSVPAGMLPVQSDHKHCICGDGACTAEGHTHATLDWWCWTANNSLPTTAGNWYLANDVTLAATYVPPTGVNLCLNGHVVKGNDSFTLVSIESGAAFQLTDCDKATGHNFSVNATGYWTLTDADKTVDYEDLTARPNAGDVVALTGGVLTGGYVSGYGTGGIAVKGVFTMYGGTLVGNCNMQKHGGAIWIGKNNSYSVTLAGGRICGNYAAGCGGAVQQDGGCTSNLRLCGTDVSFNAAGDKGGAVNSDAAVTATGGRIAYNKAAGPGCAMRLAGTASLTGGSITQNESGEVGSCGAVCFDGTSSCVVGGTLFLNENYVAGNGRNLYLGSGKTITVSTATPFASGAKIGVTTKTLPTLAEPVALTSNRGEDCGYFTSDNASYRTANIDGVVKLVLPPDPVLAEPTPVAHATAAVYTNGVLSAETTSGSGQWNAWSNQTAVVVYTADAGYAFKNGEMVITNKLDTSKSPAVVSAGEELPVVVWNQRKPDYTQAKDWMLNSTLKPREAKEIADEPADDSGVDVFYIYPTIAMTNAFTTVDGFVDIDDPQVRGDEATHTGDVWDTFKAQAKVFADFTHVYVPFYRQVSFEKALEVATTAGMADANQAYADYLRNGVGYADVTNALNTYFSTWNKGRPFILASHSQGSAMMRNVIEHYFTLPANKSKLDNLVACYAIGYGVTKDWMAQIGKATDGKICLATNATDCGVYVTWNTVGPDSKPYPNLLVPNGAVSVNPLTWTTNMAPAEASLNLGALTNAAMSATVPHLYDATVDAEHGVVVCANMPSERYVGVPAFGDKSLHTEDYQAYWENLRVNAYQRIETATGRKPRCGTPTDYSDAANWMSRPATADKPVDVFYLYPTCVPGTCKTLVGEIEDGMKAAANEHYKKGPSAFESYANIYAPYYRQGSGLALISDLTPDGIQRFCSTHVVKTDVFAALDYFFTNINVNAKRPFILASHSQGSANMKNVFEEYFVGEKRPYLGKMVAAYVLGYKITPDWCKKVGVEFAEGESDTGVILTWNAEGPGAASDNFLTADPAQLAINPINWKTDNTEAAKAENLGSVITNASGVLTFVKPGVTGTRLQVGRAGAVIVDVPETIPVGVSPGFGTKSYHFEDWAFFHDNIGANGFKRYAAFAGLLEVKTNDVPTVTDSTLKVLADGAEVSVSPVDGKYYVPADAEAVEFVYTIDAAKAAEGSRFANGETSVSFPMKEEVGVWVPVATQAEIAAVTKTGTPTLKLGVVAQRYPWNGIVDINYKATFWTAGKMGAVEVTVGETVTTNELAIVGSGTVIGTAAIEMPAETKGKATFKVVNR